MFTNDQFSGCCTEGRRLLDSSWRGWFVRDERKRKWLCFEIAAAAEWQRNLRNLHQKSWSCFAPTVVNGADDRDGRTLMVKAISDRVKARNKECGFVIETIILAAIISWLVQRLLDWLFLNAPQGAQSDER